MKMEGPGYSEMYMNEVEKIKEKLDECFYVNGYQNGENINISHMDDISGGDLW